jgi:acetoin utilization protein AcuB
MIVEDVMQTSVTTVTPKTLLTEAARLLRHRGIRHLPVVEDHALVGIVSDRDLKRAVAPSPETSSETPQVRSLREGPTVDAIMTRVVITVGRTFPIEEAARRMVTEKVSALPVTEGGRLIGIVTEPDVLELFVKAMGTGEPSSRIDVRLSDDGVALADLVHAVEEAPAEICSVMTLRNRSGHKDVVIRVRTIDPRSAIACLGARGYTVRTPRRD